jgi:dihydrofolate reductase
MQKPRISIVVAIGRDNKNNHVIGQGSNLLWHIPDDLKRFKALTLGHPIIMGRKTFESIVASLGKPLPGRTNIVVTRDESWNHEDVLVFHTLEQALERAKKLDQEEVHIGGGAQIYEQALPYVDKLYLTLIDDEKEGDAFFPEYEKEFTKKTFEAKHEWQRIKYAWVDLERE